MATRTPAAAIIAIGLLLSATACGETTPKPVPDVTGDPLNVAEDTLDALGLRYRTVGGGAFGIVIRSHWLVCRQTPRPRRIAREVVLTVSRACSIPDTVGESLEDAEEQLERSGVDVREHSLDGEPIVAEALWTVCRQEASAGAPLQLVDLYVSHDCAWPGDDE